MSEINLLKKAQAASKSKYEKEQIAWNILTLKQKLNDVNIDDLRKRAEGELKRPSIDLVLK